MAKLYDDPIDAVAVRADGSPLRWRWRGRLYVVDQQLAAWCAVRARPGRDAELFRVSARPAGHAAESTPAVYDLARVDGGWRLVRLWD